MGILTGYSGCSENDIRAMSKKELQEAVIRAFATPSHKFLESDS